MKRPIITVCLLRNWRGEQLARGIAICGGADNPCKQIGRTIAKGRAVKALVHKKRWGLQIRDALRREVARKLPSEEINRLPFRIGWGDAQCFKAIYQPLLTEFESKLLITEFESKLLRNEGKIGQARPARKYGNIRS